MGHGILLSRLSQCIGDQGSAYTWFESYLSNLSQFVQIKDTSSSDRQLTGGLSQGFLLCPILYLVYTSPLGAILRPQGVGFHMYAGNTQLYLYMKTTKLEDVVSARTRVEVCLAEVAQWHEARGQDLPLGELRKRLLLRATTKNINAVTPQKCMQWYNHVQTYLPRCLNREEIQG